MPAGAARSAIETVREHDVASADADDGAGQVPGVVQFAVAEVVAVVDEDVEAVAGDDQGAVERYRGQRRDEARVHFETDVCLYLDVAHAADGEGDGSRHVGDLRDVGDAERGAFLRLHERCDIEVDPGHWCGTAATAAVGERADVGERAAMGEHDRGRAGVLVDDGREWIVFGVRRVEPVRRRRARHGAVELDEVAGVEVVPAAGGIGDEGQRIGRSHRRQDGGTGSEEGEQGRDEYGFHRASLLYGCGDQNGIFAWNDQVRPRPVCPLLPPAGVLKAGVNATSEAFATFARNSTPLAKA